MGKSRVLPVPSGGGSLPTTKLIRFTLRDIVKCFAGGREYGRSKTEQ